jgi:hypothetical protein
LGAEAGTTSPAAGSPTTADQNSEPGWVYTDAANADFVQWTRAGSEVTGSLSSVYLAGVGALAVTTRSDAFTGIINKDNVTLTFPQGLGSVTSVGAQLQGSDLVVSFPQPDGTLEPLTLHAGSATEYNEAVAALQAQAAGNVQASESNAAAAAQQSAAAAASASVAAQHQQDQEYEQADLASLVNDSKLSGDVAQLADDASQTGTDLNTTRSDAAQGQGTDCENVSSTVYNDAASLVYNDAVSLTSNDIDTLTRDIATVQSDIATLKSAVQTLAADGGSDPSAAGAIATAHEATVNARSKANTDIASVNSDVDAAYSVANGLATGSCAGDGPGSPPTPLPQI